MKSKKMKPRDDGRHPAPLRVKVEKRGVPWFPVWLVWLECGQQGFLVTGEFDSEEDAAAMAKHLRLAVRRGRAWDRGER